MAELNDSIVITCLRYDTKPIFPTEQHKLTLGGHLFGSDARKQNNR